MEQEPEEVRREWLAAASSPDWGDQVVRALRERFESPVPLLEPAELLDATTERDADGVAVLRATYRHPYYSETIGLRRRLDEPPAVGLPDVGMPLAAWLADWIAVFDISEPLGRVRDGLVRDDDGVGWWGDGFPSPVGPHPLTDDWRPWSR